MVWNEGDAVDRVHGKIVPRGIVLCIRGGQLNNGKTMTQK